MKLVAIAALLAVGGSAAAKPNVALDWRMRVDGKQLLIDYTIANHTRAPIDVADQITQAGAPNQTRLIVVMENDLGFDGGRADRIALVRGSWQPKELDAQFQKKIDRPTFVTLRAGESRHWRAMVPWPLFEWVPSSYADKLTVPSRDVVLRIEYVQHERGAKPPEGCDERFVVGRPKPFPKE
jgi:hypothetical protein